MNTTPPSDIVSALKRIKNMNVSIIDDKTKVCALLNDIAPNLKKERRRVKSLYETGAIRSVAKAVSAPDGARLYLMQAVQILIDEADMTNEAACETVGYFAKLWQSLAGIQLSDGSGKTKQPSLDDALDELDRAAAPKVVIVPPEGAKKRSSRTGGGQPSAARSGGNQRFNQPLRSAGRGNQPVINNYNPTGSFSRPINPTQTSAPRKIYGSFVGRKGAAGTPAQGGGQQPTQSAFAMRVTTKPNKQQALSAAGAMLAGIPAGKVNAAMAEQSADDLCKFYRGQLASSGSDPAKAKRLSQLAMKLTPIFPKYAVKLYMESVKLGGAEQLSLFGRQILAWQEYLSLESAMGFACIKLAVDRGSPTGELALAHCFHNGVGICRCDELAERYYKQALARHPELDVRINDCLGKLARGEQSSETLWRYY